jgi:hypothetical protein
VRVMLTHPPLKITLFREYPIGHCLWRWHLVVD